MAELRDVVTKATSDQAFRKELLANPDKALKSLKVKLDSKQKTAFANLCKMYKFVDDLMLGTVIRRPGYGVTYPPLEITFPSGGIHIQHGGGVLYFGPEQLYLKDLVRLKIEESIARFDTRVSKLKNARDSLK